MTQTQEELCDQIILTAWQKWCPAGLEAVELTLGPLKQEPNLSIFKAGWMLGYQNALEIAFVVSQIERSIRIPQGIN